MLFKPILGNQWHSTLFGWNNPSLLRHMEFMNGCKWSLVVQYSDHQSMTCLGKLCQIIIGWTTTSLQCALLTTGIHYFFNKSEPCPRPTISLKQLELWLLGPCQLSILQGQISNIMSPGEMLHSVSGTSYIGCDLSQCHLSAFADASGHN